MKKSSFSKKLLSLFLAVVMALSCCTAAFTAFAANSADTESNLYEANNEYDYLGWVKTTDEQKLSALLDMLDELLPTLGIPTTVISIKDILNGLTGSDFVYNSGILEGPNVTIELSSVNGVLNTIASLEGLVEGLRSTVVNVNEVLSPVLDLNLKGVYKGYAENGSKGAVMSRENSTSKEIIGGILNILYMNTNDKARNSDSGKNHRGGPIIQKLLKGDGDGLIFKLAGQEINVYDILKPTLAPILGYSNPDEMPANWARNLVNNLLVRILQTLVINPMITSEDKNFPNRIDTSGDTWSFITDDNKVVSLEYIICEILNKLVFPEILNIESKPVFDSSHKLSYSVTDSFMSQFLSIARGVMDNVLAPLFGTISLDFGYIPELTRMYTGWRMEQANHPTSYKDAGTYWGATMVKQWITADYKNIAKYLMELEDWDGVKLCPDITEKSTSAQVTTAMESLFTRLDRSGENGVDLTYLFTNMLYSPVAAAMGWPTGTLNLTVRDSYFGMYEEKYASVKNSLYKADAASTVYRIVTSLVGELFPTLGNIFENAGETETPDTFVSKLITGAGKLLTLVADNANPAILADFHAKAGEKAFLTESNLEDAVAPLTVGAVRHAETFSQVHDETWNKVGDLNGLFFLLMTEYLKSVLPGYDYSGLAPLDSEGHYTATLEGTLLPMARDIIAVIGQGIVPMGWDVFKNGGCNADGTLKDNTSVFDVVNNVVCFFMNDLGIAQLLGLTEIAMNNGKSGSTASVIKSGSGQLFNNINTVINRFVPALNTLFETNANQFDSEAFFYNMILKGLLNSGDVVEGKYGHGKQGLSALLYNLSYLFFESAPLNNKRVISVLYDFIKDLVNAFLAPRHAGDEYKVKVIPDNDDIQPITDLIQGKVLFGIYGNGAPKFQVDVDQNGVLGVAIARIVEATGGAGIRLKNVSGTPQYTTMNGIMNLVYIVNSIVTFLPSLGQSTLHGAKASFTQSNFNDYNNSSLESNNVYMRIENPSAGIKRAVMTNEGTTQNFTIDRYFMSIKNIECVNDGNISVSKTYYSYDAFKGVYNADSGKTSIKPGETSYFRVTGTPSSLETKEFKVTYKIVDKNGNLYQDYDNLTTYAYMNFSDTISFVNELYKDGTFASGYVSVLQPGEMIGYDGDKINVKATKAFTGYENELSFITMEDQLSVAYPTSIVVNSSNGSELDNMKLTIRNYSDTYDGSGLNKLNVYPVVNGKVPVACDKDGNLIDYSQGREYYHPITKTWDKTETIQYSIGGIVKDFYYTESRWHVSYKADEAKAMSGYEADIDNGVIYIDYNADVLSNVSCVSPVKGTYIKAADLAVNPVDNYLDNAYSWIHAIPGASIEVVHGDETINLGVGFTNDYENYDLAGTVSDAEPIKVNAIPQSASKRSELESKMYQAIAFVDAHADSDFVNGAAVLSKVHEEIKKAYNLVNSTPHCLVSDATYEVQIKALNDAMNAEIKVVDGKKVDYANKVAKEVVDDFNMLSAYDHGNINYNLTRNVKQLGWNVLSSKYDNPTFVEVTEKDKDFSSLKTYVFKNAKGEVVDTVLYTTFLIKLAAGAYEEAYGLTPTALAGTDYTFGYEEPQFDDWGSIKYIYSSNASIVEMKEIIRIYNLYKSYITTRAYADNSLTIKNEINCATNKDYTNLTVNGGEVYVADKTAGVKYGAVAADGKITNDGTPHYTEESWADYVDAVAAAVQATKDQNAKVSELESLRLNVMYAENNLEVGEVVHYDTWTYIYKDGTKTEIKVVEGSAEPEAPAIKAEAEYKPRTSGSPALQKNTHGVYPYSWKLVGDKTYQETIAATPTYENHTVQEAKWTVERVEPTRDKAGSETKRCVCGYNMGTTVLDPLGVNVTFAQSAEDKALGSVAITAVDVKDKAVVTAEVNNVKYASSYTLKAVPNANAKFVGWYTGNKLVSREYEYTTSAYADTTYRAVFAEIEDDSFTVTFMGYCNDIVLELNSKDLKSFTKYPTVPNDFVGVSFAQWSHTVEEIQNLNEATIVYAQYEKTGNKEFTINADGCRLIVDNRPLLNKATVAYDALVTVSPADSLVKATAWYLNGELAGYGEKFTFYCSGNTVVTYTTDVVEKVEPIVVMLNATEDPETHRVRFLASRSVPEREGLKLIESGFVYGKGMEENDLVLENVGMACGSANGTVGLMKNSNTSNEGQFAVTFGVKNQAFAASARAYLIYEDEAGTHVIYSDAIVHPFDK